MDTVDTIFQDEGVVVSNVKPDNRMVNTVARANASDHDFIAARLQIEFLEDRFHRRFIKTIVRSLLNDIFSR